MDEREIGGIILKFFLDFTIYLMPTFTTIETRTNKPIIISKQNA
jgi:hypothetical protein